VELRLVRTAINRSSEESPMRKVQRETPKAQKRGQRGAVAKKARTSQGQASQEEAVAEIMDGVPEVVRSVRVVIVGASQKGKTTFARKLCSKLAADGVLVIHDHKFPDHAQYSGVEVFDQQQLRDAVMDADGRVIPGVVVCRPGVTAEDAATVVRDLAECGERATLLIDEPVPALKVNPDTGEPMERVWMGPNLTWLCLQGGGLGASIVLLCPLPRVLPASMIDSATAIVFFRTGGRSLTYSKDYRMLPPEAMPVVSKLAVGQCAMFWAEEDWDGRTFGPN
jgi:hypothetical protein